MEEKMKKILLLTTFLLLSGCSVHEEEVSKVNQSNTTPVTLSNSTKNNSESQFSIFAAKPEYKNNDTQIVLKGIGKPDSDVTVSLEKTKEEIVKTKSDSSGSFVLTFAAPKSIDFYIFENDTKKTILKLYSKDEFLNRDKNIEIAKAKELEDKKKQEDEKKQKEEQQKIEDEKKRQEDEKKQKEEQQKKLDEEREKNRLKAEETKNKEKSKAQSREQENALSSAKDYLEYSGFSKSSLYDQLIYEKYPDDAARFAVENVDTDWKKNALRVAKSYLDYTSFSDAGLRDQLSYEGFSDEEINYALNNI